MRNTHEMTDYIAARQIGKTDVIDAAADDPVLLQAAEDGYADRVGEQWIARGRIQPGEQRVVRFIFGGTQIIVGK